MQCPKCKNQPLARKGYNTPYACPSCDGLWVKQKALARDAQMITELDGAAAPAGEQDQRTGLCPEGHGILLRARVELDEPFFLERCTTCGGIWFDKGEWRRVFDYHLLAGLPDLWSTTWQRQRRAEASRERFLELNRESLGAEVFTSVLGLAQLLKGHPLRQRALALLKTELDEA